MPKYLIEGAIDFYSELYKSLDEEENEFKTDDDDKLCLITNQPLSNNFVTMECGHKFNYVPLFKDIENHKKNFNNMEGSTGRLEKNEIRCPYCRKKQKTLLPYYEDMGIPRVMGVNEFYVNTYKDTKNTYKYDFCDYLTCIPHYTELSITDESGNYFLKCKSVGTHISLEAHGTNYGDTKKYCYYHKKIMIRKYKTDLLNKTKAEAKLLKQKERETIKLLKQKEKKEAKIKLKEEAKKNKEESKEKTDNADNTPKIKKSQKKKQPKIENIVLGPSSVIIITDNEEIQETDGCVSLLKSGTNKGKSCGCAIYNIETKLCKRHWKKMETTYSHDNENN